MTRWPRALLCAMASVALGACWPQRLALGPGGDFATPSGIYRIGDDGGGD